MSKFTIEEMYEAYTDCIKHKKSTRDYLEYINKYGEGYMYDLLEQINTRKYKIGKSKCFVVTNPKIREIFAAEFKDRIIHHLVVNQLEPYFEKRFIPAVYSCRKGKGTLLGIQDLFKYIRTLSNNYYYLQMDIKGFFMSIDKPILFNLVDKHIRRKNFKKYKLLRYLIKKIIFYSPTKSVRKVGDISLFQKVPKHKSLFQVSSKKGLAIGNLTSQFFANVYMDELDQFVKRELQAKYYFRYVDDFIILGKKEELINFHKKIKIFLKKNLHLELLEKKTKLLPIHYDIDFIGYIIKKQSYIIPRKRTIKSMKNIIFQENIQNKELYEKTFSSINSYCGLIKHTKSFRIRKNLLRKLNTLTFYIEKQYFFLKKKEKIYDILENKKLKTMKQYKELQKKYKNHIIFMQIGCFYKAFDYHAVYVSKKLGLKLTVTNPRTSGETLMCGFYEKALEKYENLIQTKKINTIILKQKKEENKDIVRDIYKTYTYNKSWFIPISSMDEINRLKKQYYEKKLSKNKIQNIEKETYIDIEKEFIIEFKSMDIGKMNMYDIVEYVLKWKKILTNKVD